MVMQVVHRTSIVDLIMTELMVMTPFNFLVIAVNMICDYVLEEHLEMTLGIIL